MNKIGKKEVGVISVIVLMIILIFTGLIIQKNNTATNPDAKEMVDNIGSIFFWCGILGFIILVIIGLSYIIKEFS